MAYQTGTLEAPAGDAEDGRVVGAAPDQGAPERCETPVIMVTIVDDKNLGYTLGAADYITKPVDREHLGRVLNKYRCSNPPCPVLLIEKRCGVRSQ